MRLQSIRNRGTLLIIVIGVALLSMIALMDFGDTIGASRSNNTVVGKVYDNEIEKIDFDSRVKKQFNNQKQNNPNIQLDQVRNSVWSLLIRELVFQKEYDASGITVSNEELFDMIQGPDPYPTIRE